GGPLMNNIEYEIDQPIQRSEDVDFADTPFDPDIFSDPDGPAWTRIMQTIRKEKDQRHHELLLLDRRKQKLSEWKKQLEQMQYDLTVRESRILESEPCLPLARQLQEMKLSLEDALPWIETINEIAQIRNMDIKSAGVLVAQELR